MKYEIGPQYTKDDPFKKKARFHQSNFRTQYLKVDFDSNGSPKYRYGNYLSDEDILKGLNYYNSAVFQDALNQYPITINKKQKQLHGNLLRSEHIPFNFFVPLKWHTELLKSWLSKLLSIEISSIDEIRIEYAPPKLIALNDATAFDVYISYQCDSMRGAVGIEIKYTEQAYKLKKDSKEANEVSNQKSIYYEVSRRSGVFKNDVYSELITDKYRQVWRNHLLGETMIKGFSPNATLDKFNSIILFPNGNSHFHEIVNGYKKLLTPEHTQRLIGITYEEFIDNMRALGLTQEQNDWIDYLENRYIVK